MKYIPSLSEFVGMLFGSLFVLFLASFIPELSAITTSPMPTITVSPIVPVPIIADRPVPVSFNLPISVLVAWISSIVVGLGGLVYLVRCSVKISNAVVFFSTLRLTIRHILRDLRLVKTKLGIPELDEEE